jgi:NAD+ synthase (glutamine-hydrolysing)/outer membrane lipoprotein carrier protein
VALSLLSAAPARADRLDEVLAEMGKAGKRLKTMTADFAQTDHDFILKDQEESRGKLYLAVPGRIRWEYSPPREKVLVVKDDLVRLFNPTANQVHEFRRGKGAKSGGADLLIGFGSGNERIRESYDVSLIEETDSAVSIALVPKPDSQASLFTKIELTLDKTTWTPVRSVFHSPNRNRADIRFESVVLNRDLPPATFELKLPPNVEIIRN